MDPQSKNYYQKHTTIINKIFYGQFNNQFSINFV